MKLFVFRSSGGFGFGFALFLAFLDCLKQDARFVALEVLRRESLQGNCCGRGPTETGLMERRGGSWRREGRTWLEQDAPSVGCGGSQVSGALWLHHALSIRLSAGWDWGGF